MWALSKRRKKPERGVLWPISVGPLRESQAPECSRAGLRYARRAVTEPQLSFMQRLAIAWRALMDAGFAARVLAQPETPPAVQLPAPAAVAKPARDLRPALQLLAVLQREGRLVDFIQQDIATYSDADVGAAARVVHDGCRRAIQGVAQLESVRSEAEGQSVTIPGGFDAHALRLTGNVSGEPPFRGQLRHKGWRVTQITLPDVVDESDCTVVAPAEVEL